MSININDLPLQAQQQIARKLDAQGKGTAPEKRKVQRKYNNTPEERNAENARIRFDSKAEARRYDELMLMLKAGKIRNLKLQPQFTLQEAYTTPEGEHIRAIRYQADFSYEYYSEGLISTEGGGVWLETVEDVKGGKATKTRTYIMKKKMMQEKYGIRITEIG